MPDARSRHRPARLVDWYRRNRARSRAIFDLIDPAAYYSRPIALRNPDRVLRGAPAGVQRHRVAASAGSGRRRVDARLEKLFERGIDPDSVDAAVPRSGAAHGVAVARRGARVCASAPTRRIVEALDAAAFDERPPAPCSAREAIFTALEHEAMHQETLLYMWHRLPYAQKRSSRRVRYRADGR